MYKEILLFYFKKGDVTIVGQVYFPWWMWKHEATEATMPSVILFYNSPHCPMVCSSSACHTTQTPASNVQEVNIHPTQITHSLMLFLWTVHRKVVWVMAVKMKADTPKRTHTHTPLYPLLLQCIHLSSIPLHDFISLCGYVAPMCFWQLYGGLAGPHNPSGSVNLVFSVVSFPPAWWRRRPGNACLRPLTSKQHMQKQRWVIIKET